jgi:hypothetical protein
MAKTRRGRAWENFERIREPKGGKVPERSRIPNAVSPGFSTGHALNLGSIKQLRLKPYTVCCRIPTEITASRASLRMPCYFELIVAAALARRFRRSKGNPFPSTQAIQRPGARQWASRWCIL